MGPEAKIQSKVVRYARAQGVLAYKFNSDSHNGVPDYLFLYFGVLFIEFKAPGKKPTALQLAEHDKMRDRGITVHVCDNVDAGYRMIDTFTHAALV